MKHKLILASASPRRKQFLVDLGIAFEVCVSNAVEIHLQGEAPDEYVIRNACEKATTVKNLKFVGNEQGGAGVILGADTIVVSPKNKILEKPVDEADAIRMLKQLSGQWHRVVSGFALVDLGTGEVLHKETVETRVCFRDISHEEIIAYVSSGESADKAGAYGIQGKASAFVKKIDGSYTNVVGLPLCEVILALEKINDLKLFKV